MLPSRHDNCEKKVVYLLIDIISFNVYCHRYYNNLRLTVLRTLLLDIEKL